MIIRNDKEAPSTYINTVYVRVALSPLLRVGRYPYCCAEVVCDSVSRA